ncbi:hypothetical protein COV12_02850 [Candidatus Woesearchaeota archaeon CG10_big_fil_rev_8_21_14_0_10_32_24]|nr:MAG: hypothetical protein COV12_02850 [Candidatus Woesearchaeota archaeon CG10_big_fil_rev_8_21_14_0_10_32_24]
MQNQKGYEVVFLYGKRCEDGTYTIEGGHSKRYAPLNNSETVDWLVNVIKEREEGQGEYPAIFVNTSSCNLPPSNGRPTEVTETIYQNGQKNKRILYDLNYKLVRNLYLCDIIKNWEFDEF